MKLSQIPDFQAISKFKSDDESSVFSAFKLVFRANLFLFFILFTFSGNAQSKKELQNKKAQLSKDIAYTNKLLSLTKRNKSTSLNVLVTLNKKISKRSELINTISTELTGVEKEIGKVSTNIDSLNRQLVFLKKQYAGMVFYAYKNQNSYSH